MTAPILMPDLSHYQGHHTVADFKKAAKVAAGFMFKATDGTGFTDSEFVNNAQNCRQAGLPFGAYHYVQQGSPAAQAAHFLSVTLPHRPAFLCVDWELGDKATARDLMTVVKKKLPPDVSLILYIGAWGRAHGGVVGNPDALIVPDYGPASLPGIYVPSGAPLGAWQYTDGVPAKNGTKMPSSIPGIGPCDISVVYLPRFFGIKPPQPPKPDHIWRYVATGDPTQYRLAVNAWRHNAAKVKAGTAVTFKRVDIAK